MRRLGGSFFKRNTIIVLLNILTACMLLFCCCFFFFANIKMFGHDFTSYMAFVPILFFAGIVFVCFYIINLVTHLELRTSHRADRFDLAYKVVFSLTLMILIIRSFLGDFMGETIIINEFGEHIVKSSEGGTSLNVPVPIIVIACISGLITWLTPKIKDNDNTEF